MTQRFFFWSSEVFIMAFESTGLEAISLPPRDKASYSYVATSLRQGGGIRNCAVGATPPSI
jgi:hypothetical protein